MRLIDYIGKDDLLNGIYSENPKDVMKYIAVFPTADVVSKGLYDQVKFERDALQAEVDKRKVGKWIVGADWSDDVGIYICSECANFAMQKTAFCPNCGCKIILKGDENG